MRLKFMLAVGIAMAGLTSLAMAEEVKIDIPAIEQQKAPQWCWAASIQNVLASYDVKVKMEDVVKATYGRVDNLPLFDPRQAVTNLMAANALVAPKGKVVQPFIIPGPPAPAVLVQELSREKSPIIVMYKNPQGGGHCVVCIGAEYEKGTEGIVIKKVIIADPGDGKTKEWRGRDLAALWTASVFIRVADKPVGAFAFQNTPLVVTPTYEVVGQFNVLAGRIWYFKEDGHWHFFDLHGQDLGAIPDAK